MFCFAALTLSALTVPAAHDISRASRRVVITGACKSAALTLLATKAEVALAATVPADECLSCKLKETIAAGGNSPKLEIGADVSSLLSSPSELAVKDVMVGRNPSKFDATMKRVLSKHDPEKVRVLVWVQSELVGPNRIPWCPDTRAALPLLESALYRASAEQQPIVLVTADVVREDYYRADYPYRTDSKLRLSGVPTLYRWGRDGPVRRLQEGQITAASLDALLV